MSNYAQTRTSPTAKGGTSLAHDLRLKKPNYLRDDMYHNRFANVYSNPNIKELKAQIRAHEQTFKSLYKERTGRNPQKGKASPFLEGVITLSNSVNDQLMSQDLSPTELNALFAKAVVKQLDKIEDITGTRPQLIEYAIHYDEKTPHLHYLCTNYDQEGKSIHHTLKTSKRMSELQDQVGEDFKPIGFKRGERKGFSKKLSIAQMHEREIQSLMDEKHTVRQEIADLKQQKKDLKSTIADKEQLKQELDNLDKALKIKREEQKGLQSDISRLESVKSSLRANMSVLEQEETKLLEQAQELRNINEHLKLANEHGHALDEWDETLANLREIEKRLNSQNEDVEEDWREQLNEVPELPKSRRYK